MLKKLTKLCCVFRNWTVSQEILNGLILLKGTFIDSSPSMKCLQREEVMGKHFLLKAYRDAHCCVNVAEYIVSECNLYMFIHSGSRTCSAC